MVSRILSVVLAALCLLCQPMVGDGGRRVASASEPMSFAQQVAMAQDHGCFTTADQRLFCWGSNDYGQLGDGTRDESPQPKRVATGFLWKYVATDFAVTCAIDNQNDAYCWGRNKGGVFGSGNEVDSQTPVLVTGGHKWQQISGGSYHSDNAYMCGITLSNEGFCWGNNTNGRLGLGFNAGVQLTPGAIASVGEGWSEISAGQNTTCGVTLTGAGYCWGNNLMGQVGNGDTSDSVAPVSVAGAHQWRSISTSAMTSCGVTTGNVGYCWGSDGFRQVGNSGYHNTPVPVLVDSAPSFDRIEVGIESVCALDPSGNLWCWGRNNVGEFGRGDRVGSDVPERIYSRSGLRQITLTRTFCGVGVNGTVYCGGLNTEGQVGDGTLGNRWSHVQTWYLATESATVQLQVEPELSFRAEGRSAAAGSCNGAVISPGVDSSSTNVPLGSVSVGSRVGAQTLRVSTNAATGYVTYVRQQAPMQSAGHTMSPVTGSNAAPLPFATSAPGGIAPDAFGYTTSALVRFSPNYWAAGTPDFEEIASGEGPAVSEFCVAFRADAATSTPAGAYQADLTYRTVPTF